MSEHSIELQYNENAVKQAYAQDRDSQDRDSQDGHRHAQDGDGSSEFFLLYGDIMNPFAASAKADDEEASIGEDSLVSDFPVADAKGNQVQYPSLGEDDEKPKQPTHQQSQSQQPHSVIGSGIESLKYLLSIALLAFSVAVVMAAIFSNQTLATGENNIHPVVAFTIFWFLVCWLAMMEGGQGAIVGLEPIDSKLYQHSHPRTYKSTALAHQGNNMERFIVGRQFLVVLVVFVINMMATSTSGAKVLGLSDEMAEVFLNSGLAVILTTIMLGQLTAQVNAANCMLDFTNNYFVLFTAYVSLAIEKSGIMHAVYLVQILFAKLTGKPVESNEPPRSAVCKGFFWIRVLFSLTLLGVSFAVTLSAIVKSKTGMWDGVPVWASVIILFLLMTFVGIMEGMQIALFAVVNLPEAELSKYPRAHENCQLTFSGQNLQAFLIGRQVCVTICTFVVARITSVNVDVEDENSENIFGVSNGLQAFINTGLLGAVITTIMASLIWRIIASSFPIGFLSNPTIYVILRLCLMLEKSGVCSASWVLARYQKLLVHYQPDEIYLEGAERQTAEPVTRRDKDIYRLVTVLKFTYSLALLVFSLALVMGVIFTKQTVATKEHGIHPLLACFIFWFLICWLAMMEGGQGALVGLQPIAKERYAGSHPRALRNTVLAHKGDYMNRFIVGRQFLVVLVVFVTNMMTTLTKDASVFGLPDILNETFLSTGLAVVLVTIILGQLTAQVNAANCMLDFLNNYFMLLTTYVSLAIEISGLLHSVYLVQHIFSKITGKPVIYNEPPRSRAQKFWFWMQTAVSVIILGFSCAVTLSALFSNKTTMWEGVPEIASVFIFFVLMTFVGILEGMQIALFSLVNLPEEELARHPTAHANCKLAFHEQNLQAFLIGRQICVTVFMFVVARITSVNVDTYGAVSDNIFGVSDGLQKFFNTGLLGAVITTVVASLAWRIIASSFPVAFLSNPLIRLFIRLCLFLEASGACSAAWMLGRFNKKLAGYQPDGVYLQGMERHTSEPVTRRDKDIDVTVTLLKYVYSMGLLVFSITVVMAGIWTKQTNVAESISPILAFCVIWGLILWLAMMEGGQGCFVGLQPINKDLYHASHPVSHKTTSLVHKGDNMERFIIGRQFLVVLVVFVINMCGGAIPGASVLGLSGITTDIFLASGVAMILMTIMLGQLTAQVNAANCMLDFINNYFMLFTTYVSLAIEASGLLHSVYLVQILFAKMTGNPIESNEPPRSVTSRALFWIRVVFSVAVLGFAFAVTLSALFQSKTTMYEGVPAVVSVIVFFLLMCFVGLMEGMQIALFAVVNMPDEELRKHPAAAKTCRLTFSGNNMQAFLIGRQICVTLCMFVVARITAVDVDVGGSDSQNIFGVSDSIQSFFNTGLLGAVITTVVASLIWRIIASSFPVAFLSNPLVNVIIRLCLLLEASGVCSAVWLLARCHKHVAGYELDEVYIGTAEDRAASTSDDEMEVEEVP